MGNKPQPHHRKSRIVARGVFLHGNHILLAQLRGRPNIYYLPGGSVEEGETGAEALRREMREEIGSRIRKVTLIGAVEYRFDHGRRTEVNLVYTGSLPPRFTVRSRKELFSWHPLTGLPRIPFFPKSLIRAFNGWRNDTKQFCISEDRGKKT